ncbi:glycoside hydrolase family 92 protein, partial [Vibrio sp. 1074]|nr:glycoside hydrolase family 92 protein [Vibrio sp. 1074]
MKLKRTLLSTAVLTAMLGLAGCGSDSDPETPVISTPTLEFVDTLIGTKGLGNVNPSPVMPEGMIQPSPDNFDPNGWNGKGSPVEYDPVHSLLSGFSMTHISGAGKGDLNDFSFLPYTGFNTDAVTMDKSSEVAEVGYYSVDLVETGIKAELSATDRVAFQRYTFKPGEDRKVRI